MTQRDKWLKPARPAVQRYRDFKDECARAGVILPESGASVTFVLPVSRSWSAKKKAAMIGQPHQQRPDVSNLLKALEDALYLDDSAIWHYAGLKKVWGEEGQIVIEVSHETD